MFFAALATGGGTQIATPSHRKVDWGYGCGGNCAVNTSGESETAVDDNPPHVHLEDHGSLTQRMSDPSGLMITTTRWDYKFHGTGAEHGGRLEYELQIDKRDCKQTREITAPGKKTSRKQIACIEPPKKWILVCDRKNLPVKGGPRPAWVCSPAENFENFGTEFPWVFGVDGPITTVVSGEPHATTTYEATPPTSPND
jgi:hypothetical protein